MKISAHWRIDTLIAPINLTPAAPHDDIFTLEGIGINLQLFEI